MTPSPGRRSGCTRIFSGASRSRPRPGVVGMSLRNFVRRFKQATGDSPLIYLQKLRVAAAKRLLESDHRTMQEISDAVGYQDVAYFRMLFQRHTGASPSAYRRRFGV